MNTVFFLWLTLMFGAPSTLPAEHYNVEGKITISSSYCGGAAPDPEMLRALQTPKAFAGKQLYIRKGKTNDLSMPIVDTVIADAEGHFSTQLTRGTYTIISDLQLDRSIFNRDFGNNIVVDTTCLENWWSSGLTTITLEADTARVNFHFSRRCFVPEDIPCLNYMGPYPP